jgi:hypothetical protein
MQSAICTCKNWTIGVHSDFGILVDIFISPTLETSFLGQGNYSIAVQISSSSFDCCVSFRRSHLIESG